MKTKTTMAIITASAMMLALMGCGEAAPEASPATSDISFEEVAPSTDTATEDTSSEAEAASSETSTEESSASDDASIEVNGKKVSILDDFQTAFDALGPADGDPTSDASKSIFYSFASGAIEYTTVKIDGEELPTTLDIRSGDFKTSKGIGIGSTEDEVVEAYGEPTDVDNGEGVVADNGTPLKLHVTTYDLDGYSISFKYDDDKKVAKYWFNNTANNAKYNNQ
ncbi:hypothetical protein D6853_08570 [Butyrivibrio sp. X503]|uniref:hypothetical protein n=1 Tax=Butyrivibrio sp. X503 TaxID=2364878 RepID=UPI000EAA2A22|nr:hypothetical protein [Butyrivibrio sp. X503]RKM55599.1 hypothetical protein D6853_08570 [Butyrivibrio sp. X503]